MRKVIGVFLLVISFVLACTGGILVYQKIHGYEENEEIYENVASMAVQQKKNADSSERTEDQPERKPEHTGGNGMKENEYKEEYDGPTIDWEVLKGKNAVAWIMFGDDNEIINYPVMQGDDNAYYLNHAYDGTYNANGSVFMNTHNDADFRDMNTIIYGHNLRSGRMFGTFKHYLAGKDGKELRFYIYTPDGKRRTYEIISIAETKDGGYAYNYAFSKINEYKEYLSQITENSAYDTGYDSDVTKRVVTLSTCRSIGSAQGWRVIIVGKEAKVETVQKPASWYKKSERSVVTILDVEESIKKASAEIAELKKQRKENELKAQKEAVNEQDKQTGSQPEASHDSINFTEDAA